MVGSITVTPSFEAQAYHTPVTIDAQLLADVCCFIDPCKSVFLIIFLVAEGETSLVFVDAAGPGEEESIELVSEPQQQGEGASRDRIQQLHDAQQEGINDRTDIKLAEALPSRTIEGLFYNTQDALNQGKSMVMSKPRIDEQIQECIASLAELLQTPAYEPLHPVGEDVKGLLVGAIAFANKNSTSLSSANEILDTSLEVYRQACNSVADKFDINPESATSLAEYKRCERERQELLKKASHDDADEREEQGQKLLEEAITSAKSDAGRVLERHRKEDEAQMLDRFKEKRDDVEILVNTEISELNVMSDNSESDIQKAEKSLESLTQSAQAAFNLYTEKDKELCLRLQQNRGEQEELGRRLTALQALETDLEGERDARKYTQERAEQTEQRVRENITSWKKQITDLYNGCQAALTVMWQFKEGSTKLFDASIASKIEEQQRLHELDIMAQRALRDSLAAAAVDAQQTLDTALQNVDMLRKRMAEKKEERNKATKQGVARVFVEEIQRDLNKYKEAHSNFQRQRAESEEKVKTYKEQLASADERLRALGEMVESFQDIYDKYQKEKEAIWDQPDDSSLNSLEDY